MNRLQNSTSPYLLQHADNPVDWWPWGDEAFAEAARRDVPVMLSVGYAACHWCHVMAHESFEDPQTAALVNEHVVAVKVDREERPDVDAVYMTATQAMTGQGGWPMTVFMTPDREPFFCGTYFPRDHFSQLVRNISTAWRDQRDDVAERAKQIVTALADNVAATPARCATTAPVPGRRWATAGSTGSPKTRSACGSARSRTRRWRHWTGIRRRQRRVRRGAEVPAVDGAGVPAASPPADRIARRAADGRSAPARRWPAAACTTSWAAGSPGTRSTPPGSCRTSRRCSTTTRCSLACT